MVVIVTSMFIWSHHNTTAKLEHPQSSTVNDAVSLQKRGLIIKNSIFILVLRRLQCSIADARRCKCVARQQGTAHAFRRGTLLGVREHSQEACLQLFRAPRQTSECWCATPIAAPRASHKKPPQKPPCHHHDSNIPSPSPAPNPAPAPHALPLSFMSVPPHKILTYSSPLSTIPFTYALATVCEHPLPPLKKHTCQAW